jgi:hypothetical protein
LPKKTLAFLTRGWYGINYEGRTPQNLGSQQPTANSQQPTANSQQPTANSQQPTANSQQPIMLIL